MIRELKVHLDEIERHDLVILSIDRGRHYKVRVATPDGRTAVLTVSSTANDVGCARNTFRAQLRRLARGKPMESDR